MIITPLLVNKNCILQKWETSGTWSQYKYINFSWFYPSPISGPFVSYTVTESCHADNPKQGFVSCNQIIIHLCMRTIFSILKSCDWFQKKKNRQGMACFSTTMGSGTQRNWGYRLPVCEKPQNCTSSYIKSASFGNESTCFPFLWVIVLPGIS